MGQEIYLLFSCDVWKSESSMGLIVVSTDKSVIIEFVEREIRAGNMIYGGCEDSDNPTEEEISDMLDNLDEDQFDLRVVDSQLEYGYIQITNDGEEV